MGVITETQARILDLQRQRSMLRYWYPFAARQRRELRLREVHPSKEALKAKLLTQYDLIIKDMLDEINQLSDEIFILESGGNRK